MPKISAAIIARDNEREIAACIKSIKGLDEIIVLDTGSKDKTPSIATGLGAKVFYYRWDNDFAAARNRVIDYIQNPWVFSIDTDETLTTGIDSLYNLVNKHFSKRAIAIPIEDDEKLFWGLRLFRKQSTHWVGEIHEELTIQADVYTKDAHIWHSPSQNHLVDPDRNIRILRGVIDRKPTSYRDIFFLGLELHAIGQYDAAVYWLQYYNSIAPRTPNYTSEAYYIMSDCYLNLKRTNRAIESLLRATEANPEMKCAYKRLNVLTNDQKWVKKAEEATNNNVMVIR